LVTDIKVVNQDLAFSIMGRSFWILYDVTPLHEISEQVASAKAHLFQPRDAYRLNTGGRWRRPAPDPARPQYPQVGANIHYYLASDAEGEVGLEILDGQGAVVRTFSSKKVAEKRPEGEDPRRRAPRPRLAKDAGMHRFVWDFRYEGPRGEGTERTEGRGPMVPPGTYQARLTVGDWSETRSFEAKMDPRVVTAG